MIRHAVFLLALLSGASAACAQGTVCGLYKVTATFLSVSKDAGGDIAVGLLEKGDIVCIAREQKAKSGSWGYVSLRLQKPNVRVPVKGWATLRDMQALSPTEAAVYVALLKRSASAAHSAAPAVAAPPHAASGAAANKYGAIAYSPSTGAHGWSNDYPSRSAAENVAMQGCREHGGDCRVPIWFRNACGALAVGTNNGYGASWGDSRSLAESSALQECRKHASNCTVRRWACTTK